MMASEQTLTIRDLPGIADLEGRILLYRGQYDRIEEDLVGKVAFDLFGISWAFIAMTFEQRDDLLAAYSFTDDEMMAELLAIGIDFADERGQPLRCTVHLAPAAELAVRGIAGHLPDQGQAALDRIAVNLEREREAFMARKRRSNAQHTVSSRSGR